MNNIASTNLYNFSADEVMARLAANDWAGCWEYLRQLLENFTVSANVNFNVTLQKGFSDAEKRKYAEDFGALAGELLMALLLDPSSKLPDKNFMGLMALHETLHTLFYLVGLDNTDAAITQILANKGALSEGQQKKLLLLLSMNTNLDIVAIVKKVDTKYRVPAVTAYLTYMKIFDQKVYENKVKLYTLRYDLEKSPQDFKVFLAALFAYFTCSYMNTADKHTLKENINAAVQRYLAQFQKDFRRIRNMPREAWDVQIDPAKPVMFVLLEEFSKGHAMNRSWKDWVQSLNSEFSVVLLISNQKCDPSIHDDFKNVLTFNTIGDIVKMAHDLQPQVLVLPSVGMDFFGIMAANMRLAPLQIMGLGHPATTMSPFIDFVYGGERLYHPAAFPKDKYIADDSSYRFIPNLTKEQVLAMDVPRRAAGDARPLRVSIVGSNLKISHPFIALLKEIEAESPFPIHFSFHLGTVGMDSLYIQKNLATHFKDFTYYGWQRYADYFESFKNADIVLNPFPFGHTNTIIDTLLLGKPCVGMEGVEPASRTEGYVLDIVGLTEMFSAKDTADYKAKFFALSKRVMDGDAVFYDRAKIYDLLYGDAQASDFGKVLKWAYDNQKAMKTSKQKKFTVFQPVE